MLGSRIKIILLIVIMFIYTGLLKLCTFQYTVQLNFSSREII